MNFCRKVSFLLADRQIAPKEYLIEAAYALPVPLGQKSRYEPESPTDGTSGMEFRSRVSRKSVY
jgi:hypothetical protein